MKKYLFIVFLSFIASGAFAQTHKITIYSYFSQNSGIVEYLNYDKLYPDSIKTTVMIDYKKKYQVKSINTLLLRMNLDGWKILATIPDASGINGNVDTSIKYVMGKEILLDDAAMKLYLQNLDNLKK
ncbi:hypothetical protein [Mucilaginibacter lappiensis]|uniref:Uncharacterized protein n=1 Tax=Mucilaginibacter lappiensis TaxID=354630 RepID=A0A1N7FL62_9SPHI|nr:hypothetical protein [Mucilaginibacter lappiensis]MBB6112389.1 hypothetical protein [Mucilaginibacter lappiensis]MBB6127092.1 hypothetical protein [Mucilaginibacter lappiensis]SIS01030.1 hypothetical protein SAMN05421821_11880 [Mucilaginibacter lappiensis]